MREDLVYKNINLDVSLPQSLDEWEDEISTSYSYISSFFNENLDEICEAEFLDFGLDACLANHDLPLHSINVSLLREKILSLYNKEEEFENSYKDLYLFSFGYIFTFHILKLISKSDGMEVFITIKNELIELEKEDLSETTSEFKEEYDYLTDDGDLNINAMLI